MALSSNPVENWKIKIRGLRKVFSGRRGPTVTIDGIDLSIARGEFFVIVGPSGCGKTTLLRILSGLDHGYDGEVRMHQEDPSSPLFAMVFQEQSIFPWSTVRGNVGHGLWVRGEPAGERDRTVNMWLEKVGLTRFADAYPYQLSGGMKQRVSLARAFAVNPEILLMDEPFSALDEQNKTILQQELLRMWEETGKTVVYITHSVDEAIALGDRIMIMSASPGKVKQIMSVPFSRPRDVIQLRADPRYGEMVYQIWGCLADEVQKARVDREGYA